MCYRGFFTLQKLFLVIFRDYQSYFLGLWEFLRVIGGVTGVIDENHEGFQELLRVTRWAIIQAASPRVLIGVTRVTGVIDAIFQVLWELYQEITPITLL